MTDYGKALRAHSTPIPGLTVWDLPVHGDSRGWFKENWQREKMLAAGLPDFGPVQNNISFNDAAGTTRGFHAEPWDKFISIAAGRIFGAWVDLRQGPSFGTKFSIEVDPSRAVFVPRGVANAFQTLEPNTSYSYLVNDHYSPDAAYTSVSLADETLSIDWPIPLYNATLSARDRAHPRLTEIEPIAPAKVLVLGASGQLGLALRRIYIEDPNVEFADRAEIDLLDSFAARRRWRDYGTIVNAAAFTAVDDAETPAGRTAAWATNVTAVAELRRIAAIHAITLVHISSDYVFDGANMGQYSEKDPVCPLGVYGQTKAAADFLISTLPRHYILRTSWVIGGGRNFVRTMLSLAERGVNPSVVNDQVGRLTFASELARAVRHLLDTHAPYGLYNMTGSGPVTSWADIARHVFIYAGHDPSRVTAVSTAEYFESAPGAYAPRPRNSSLDLAKITETGFLPERADKLLQQYVHEQAAFPTSN